MRLHTYIYTRRATLRPALLSSAIRLILVSLLSAFCSSASAQFYCPPYGDKAMPKYRWLDSLKNRMAGDSGTIIDLTVTLDRLIAPGNDTTRFRPNQFVRITGYVLDVKDGEDETCNCHSKQKRDLDTHIELATSMTATDSGAIIVEVNRYIKAGHPEYSTPKLKVLKGRQVIIEGYLFPDSEHWHNSMNTNPKGTNLWRRTMWEVHPVTNLIVLPIADPASRGK